MINRTKHGLTLVEILVVVAIIAVLAALLVPSLKLAKEAPKRTVCESNLHQIGVAISLYAAEHNDFLPYAITQFERDRPWLVGKLSVQEVKQIPDYPKLLTAVAKSAAVLVCPQDTRPWSSSEPKMGPYRNYHAYTGSSYSFDVHLGETLANVAADPYGSLASDSDPCWHGGCPANTFTPVVNRLYGDLHVKFSP